MLLLKNNRVHPEEVNHQEEIQPEKSNNLLQQSSEQQVYIQRHITKVNFAYLTDNLPP